MTVKAIEPLEALVQEAIWTIAKTPKPFSVVELPSRRLKECQRLVDEYVQRFGVEAYLNQAKAGADVELFVFREPVMLAAYLWLMDPYDEPPPPNVLYALRGLLFGYRSEEIQRFVDELPEREDDDDE